MKTRVAGFIVFLAVLLAWVIAANAQPIPGTIVAAPLTSGDFANDFPTAFTFEIQGTDKQVADLATRDLISAARRTEGMTCWVVNEGNEYRLVGGTNNADWLLWQSQTNLALNVWTNDGNYVYFYGTVTNQTAPMVITKDGQILSGTNVLTTSPFTPGIFHAFGTVEFTSLGQPGTILFGLTEADSATQLKGAGVHSTITQNAPYADWTLNSHDSTASTNLLSLISGTSQIWFAAQVDATNRAWLTYDGNWTANGFTNRFFTVSGFMTNDANGGFHTSRDGSVLTNINNLSQSLSNYIASQATATNVVWPVQGTNVVLTTNGNTVKIDVPTQSDPVVTPGQSTAVRTNSGPNYSVDVVGTLTNQVYGTNVIGAVSSISNAPVVSAGTGITVTTNASGVSTNYTVALTSSSVTVNGTANHITTTSASIALGGSATLDVGTDVALRSAANNFTGSNYFGGSVTTATNSCNGIPDMTQVETLFSTNNVPVFGKPTGVDTTGKTAQWLLVHITNTTASAKSITSEATWSVAGTAFVTNWTDLWLNIYAASKTNAFYIPVN